MSLTSKISNSLAASVVARLDNKTSDNQAIIAYGIHVVLSNVGRTALIMLLVWQLGYLRDFIIVTALITFLRIFQGGLHLKHPISCFFSTTLYYSAPIGLAHLPFLPHHLPLYILLSLTMVSLTAKYAPADNQERPFLNPTVRQRLRLLSIITVALTLVLNWILVRDIFYFQMVTYIVMLSIYLTSPLAYKIHGRRYRNYDYANDYAC